VQRYFKTALKDGAPIVAAAVVEHFGTLNMGETSERSTGAQRFNLLPRDCIVGVRRQP
jgi:hypothetical protein